MHITFKDNNYTYNLYIDIVEIKKTEKNVRAVMQAGLTWDSLPVCT
jgi:predicted RNA-binding protein associated with RNAse of E/G family